MVVFLYPGQGSQFPGMAGDFYDSYKEVRDFFETASDACGKDMKTLLFEGSADDLKATENAQAAIVTASIASRIVLNAEGLDSGGCAGHSLGEYSALADAGVLSAGDALKAVTTRGILMAETAARIEKEKGETGMAAVLGIGPEKVRAALEGLADVWSANENSPSQVVIAGTKKAIAEAEDALKQAGGKRIIPLKVSGPFHTPLMKEASAALEDYLSGVSFNDPEKTVWSNVTAEPVKSGAEAKDLLVRQITGSVRWVDLMNAVVKKEPEAIYEAGPGKVLTGLWAKSGLTGICIPSGSIGDLEKIKNN